ncbi:exodeoxyribonuclease VII large subunit [Hymenobacter sp. HMF4947]|uniref:Exodeoxyribonuclease 7 large subunit n=1 Tax=Hymenobacter ginkgonis TaxID=2682976 RepID=A0A7K1TAK3_9BACT|nr:exodeoxyribonuclease VII large subunit [Hymenobacter ginkgonis]MVN75419.1 exodeoxyribonuclease VII large subunit [Hymenobacter ginkgonis]
MPLYPRRAAPTPAEPAAPLSLGALLTQVRAALHHRFPDSYWVVAEVAEMTRPRQQGGHCYLTLTEPAAGAEALGFTAQARATLWGSRYAQIAPAFAEATGQELRPGLRLLLRVKVTFHEQYGFSLDVLALDPSYTVGELARLRLATLRRLQEKDLLERQQELALPLGPQRLAIISSPTAAGFQDFVHQLEEAPYDFALTLFPALMQGEGAPESIRGALDAIRPRRGQFEVVILIRGGGSKTDLLAFDEYGLAAAVASFPLPVLTGIGHERDEAVVDLVAHRALKTPTAVAAFLVDRLARLEGIFLDYAERVAALSQQHLARHHAHLQRLADHSREAARQQLRRTQAALAQRSRQATQVPRQHLRQLGQQLESFRYTLPQAARRSLTREEQRLRQRSRTVLRRFARHHQRRREQLLRQRFLLQRGLEKKLVRLELKVLHLETAALRRENQILRQQPTLAQPSGLPTHNA